MVVGTGWETLTRSLTRGYVNVTLLESRGISRTDIKIERGRTEGCGPEWEVCTLESTFFSGQFYLSNVRGVIEWEVRTTLLKNRSLAPTKTGFYLVWVCVLVDRQSSPFIPSHLVRLHVCVSVYCLGKDSESLSFCSLNKCETGSVWHVLGGPRSKLSSVPCVKPVPLLPFLSSAGGVRLLGSRGGGYTVKPEVLLLCLPVFFSTLRCPLSPILETTVCLDSSLGSNRWRMIHGTSFN